MSACILRVYKWFLITWKYRHQDPEVCCCGSRIGHGGSICHHGGCRSMVEYVISSEISDLKNSIWFRPLWRLGDK